MIKFIQLTLAAAMIMAAPVWAQSYGANDAPASQARAALPVKIGKVVDVQFVKVEVPATNQAQALGGVIGAAAGAFAARDSGWQGQTLAGTVGAAVGTKAGQALSKEMRDAQQVIVQPDSGDFVAIIQEPGAASLSVGQRVYLVGQYPALRVVPAK